MSDKVQNAVTDKRMEDKLPLLEKYILHLINNNYSMNTVDSYRRDLGFFELFITMKGYDFNNINKLNIDEYKGYLRTGQHLLDIDKVERAKKNPQIPISKSQELQNIDLDPQNDQNSELNSENEPQIIDSKKSSYKGSRNGRSNPSGLNSRSVNRMLSSLRAFFVFLDDNDVKIPIPPNSIKLIKTEKKEKEVADFDELVQLIESPEQFESKKYIKYRNRALLELLFSTGMRISEVTRLDIDSLKTDPERKHILDNKIYIMGKGKKQRYVYLTERAIANIERYLEIRNDKYPALFVPLRGQRHNSIDLDTVRVSSRYVQSIIEKYKSRLGIRIPTTPHSLRHGFATYLAEKGANPAAIQRLLGHESLQTTTRYVHASDRFAEKTHEDFHPLQ